MEYCEDEQLDVQCAGDEIIAVERARYGRMRLGRCVMTDDGYIGCAADVVHILAAACSGRHHCHVDAVGTLFDGLSPCPGDLASYLEAAFRCVKGFVSIVHSYVNNNNKKQG